MGWAGGRGGQKVRFRGALCIAAARLANVPVQPQQAVYIMCVLIPVLRAIDPLYYGAGRRWGAEGGGRWKARLPGCLAGWLPQLRRAESGRETTEY